jgi:hypothetical protein
MLHKPHNGSDLCFVDTVVAALGIHIRVAC